MYVQIAIALVMMVLSYALRPRPAQPKPATLQDVQAPIAETGVPIPWVFGTVKVTGPNVLWYGDLSTTPIKKSSK
jgi:hypothetical protein